jgi:predicted nucleotidyltransferase
MINKDELLIKIREIIQAREPEAKIYLYGSRAKGNSQNDSDWDLLILLDREVITHQIEFALTSDLYDLELETGEVLSPMIYSEKEWFGRYTVTPYFHNVMQEGILL